MTVLVGLLFALLCSGPLHAQPLELPVVRTLNVDVHYTRYAYEHEGSLFLKGLVREQGYLVDIDFQTGRVRRHMPITTILGVVEGQILVSTLNRSREVEQYFFDPATLSRSRWQDSLETHWVRVDYQNGVFFSAVQDGVGEFLPYRYDIYQETRRPLDFRGAPVAITYDKQHVLASRNDGTVVAWHVPGETAAAEFPSRSAEQFGFVFPLTNALFLLPPGEPGSSEWRVASVDGSRVVTVRLTAGGFEPAALWVSRDLTRGVMTHPRSRGAYRTLLVDMSPLRTLLDRRGLIFRPRSGILNASRVRVRALPNLDAENRGYLEEGQQVQVFDRSGARMRIGEMNAHWYFVETENGLRGWSYGHFIDLQ